MELFIDSNRGIYAWREAYKCLKLSIKRQLKLTRSERYALAKGQINENYFWAIENFEGKEFLHDSKKLRLEQSEHGDIWLLEENELMEQD